MLLPFFFFPQQHMFTSCCSLPVFPCGYLVPLVTAGWQVPARARGESGQQGSAPAWRRTVEPSMSNLERVYRRLPPSVPPPPPSHPTPPHPVRASFEGCGSHMVFSQTDRVAYQQALCFVHGANGLNVLLLCLNGCSCTLEVL